MTRTQFIATVEDILDVPRGTLRESDSRDTIGEWSSIKDVHILAVIAREFGLQPSAELIEAETVGDLLAILEAHGAFASAPVHDVA